MDEKQSQSPRNRVSPLDEKQLGVESSVPPPESPDTPLWLKIALDKVGTREVSGPENNPDIVAFHAAVDGQGLADEIPWCASFVNWALQQAGVPGTRSRLARSFLSYGKHCEPTLGCIVVLRRGEPWQGHVGFYLGQRDEFVLLYGGNQSNSVRTSSYRKENVLDYRWPIIEAWLATKGIV